MNNLKVVMMMVGLMVLFLVIGQLVGGRNGMLIAFVLAAGMNLFAYWFSDSMVLKMYRARPIAAADHPLLHRVVSRVANQTMMPMPRVYVVPSRAPNAFATGRNQDHAAVAVSEGLLDILNEDELEGVIGHEMAHIRNKDMLIGTVVATFAGAVGILSSIARFGAIFGGVGSRDDNRGGGMVGLLIVAIVSPIVALLIQTAISRQREFKADAEGARTTGTYLPLASALDKLHHAPVRFNLDQRPATAHLMIANPLSGKGIANMFSTHPPVAERIERLRKLAHQQTPYG